MIQKSHNPDSSSPIGCSHGGAHEREVEHNRRQIVDSCLLIDPQALQQALSLTAGDIADAVREGRLFRVDVGEKQYYPAFFANKTIPLTELQAVAVVLEPLSGWLKWDFFTARRGSLGDRSPLEALAVGQIELVMARARSFRDEVLG